MKETKGTAKASVSKSKEDILQVAKERFEISQTEQSLYRQGSIDNLKFTYNIDNAQWDAKDITDRIRKNRPALTHNKIRKFVKQVANRERDNRMSMKVKPVDDKADTVVASILTDYIHGIEHRSKAPRIYSKNGEKALAGGFGFWRILTKYSDDSFDQEIEIADIENQFNVFLDSKGRWGFIFDEISEDEFREEYPDADPIDVAMGDTTGTFGDWFTDKKVRIAEYFYKEPVTKTLAEVAIPEDVDGHPETIYIKDGTREFLQAQGIEILREREVRTHTVKWCKINGNDIIEGWDDGRIRDWVGKDIPIIECKGEEINIAGKIYKQALIEDGKDPQKMYNYWITAQTERVALAPKAPYMLTPDQIEGYENYWKNANNENYPYMLYNADPTAPGAPRRADPPAVDMGAVRMTDIGDRDIQDGLGMYEASFGQRGNERTGKAINARSSRSDMGTFHFIDNLAEAIEETARQMIYIIPKVVDTQRMLRTRDYQGKEIIKEVNIPVFNAKTGEITIQNDLSLGKFDVEPDVKIWSTRREEASENMKQAMQYAPDIAPIISKYLFKFSDIPGAQELENEINNFMQAQNQRADAETQAKAGKAGKGDNNAFAPTQGGQ